MSNQAENKPEAKDGHILQGKYHLNFRLDPEDFAVIEQHQKELGFKNLVAAIRDILQKHGLQPEEKIIDFQTCKFYSAIIRHPEKTRCRQYGYWQTISTDQCIACQLYKNLQIPIMRPSRLEAYIDKRKNELADLNGEKKNLVAGIEELDRNTITGLQSLNHDLKEDLKDAGNLINQKSRYINKLEGENAVLKDDNEFLRSRTPIEAHEKLHSAKATVENSMVERVTEEKKVTEKFVLQQPQESKTPSQLALCPKTKEMVSFEGVCKKTCMTFMECRNYNEIVMLNRVIVKR